MQAALAERAALFAKAETPPVSSGFQLRSDGLRVENGSDSGFFGKVLRTGPNLAVLGPCFAALSAFGASYSGSVDAGVFLRIVNKNTVRGLTAKGWIRAGQPPIR